jgi:small GTP-binding protein
MSVPSFAIVGHPNKGKSSLVATLASDSSVPIAAQSGTTRKALAYPMRVGGETLYELMDTPGFQRARRALAWMQERARSAAERPQVVRLFVEQMADDPTFEAEVELLRPIAAGAGIIYVVDGALPYGAEYEAEMEVLRWSGQPSLAVINPIGARTYVSAWHDALGQYFKVVREIDVLAAGLEQRIELLQAFGELRDSWRGALKRATQALLTERDRARERSAQEITHMLVTCLTARFTRELDDEVHEGVLKAELEEKLREVVRSAERSARAQVEGIYQHGSMDRQEQAFDLLQADLFAERTWALFGLDRIKLAGIGSTGGAAAGLGLDALVGGASLFAGAAIGAIAGGAAAWLAADQFAEVRRENLPLGEQVLTLSAAGSTNLPFVLLGRARMHHQLVARRSHAARDRLVLDQEAAAINEIDSEERSKLGKIFAKLGDFSGEVPTALVADLREAIARVLA